MSKAFRPLIAINGCQSGDAPPKLELRLPYADAVLRAGGIPIALPPVGGPSDIDQVLARVDGLLLGGGDDFDTERLGLEPTHPATVLTPTAKQDWDFALARAAMETGLPTLGVCYGMQLLGLLEGAQMLQHLPEQCPEAGEHGHDTLHQVRIEEGSKLAELVGVDPLEVVSRHHQALTNVASPWRVCASDPAGIVEAIERNSHPFALGCQWHPELSPPGSPHDRILRGLVEAAAFEAHRRHDPARPVHSGT
jgi:putative glutamine amidotransferase